MDAGLLDLLEHAAHVALLAVRQGVDVELHSGVEEGVQVDRVILGDARGGLHVALEVALVVGDDHATAAQHVAGAHEQRKSDAMGNLHGLLVGLGHAGDGVGDVELVKKRAEALAVLGEVQGVGLVPMMGTPAALRRAARLMGVWPPSVQMTPSGCSTSTMSMTSSNVSGSK